MVVLSYPIAILRLRGAIWMRAIAQILFGSLMAFEFFNWIHLLSFRVVYGWFGRIFSTTFIFVILSGLSVLYRKKMQVEMHGVIWFAGSVLILTDFFGDAFFFYDRWVWYDQLAHFLSGGLIVGSLIIVFRDLFRFFGWKLPFFIAMIAALLTSTFFGVLYELEEYLEDVLIHTHRLGDGPDTANDLMMSLLGGVLILLIVTGYRVWSRRIETKL